jgi:hypothetical protein
MPKRNWEEQKFQGVDKGTGVYLKWKEYMILEIDSQGHASILSDANISNVGLILKIISTEIGKITWS